MKKCYYCNQLKDFSKFGKNKAKKDGYSTECIDCKKLLDKNYYKKNKKKISKYFKQRYLNYKELIKQKVKEYQDKNSKEIYKERKTYLQSYLKIYRQTIKAKLKRRKRDKIYNKKKYHSNVQFKLLCSLRGRIWKVLNGNPKSKRTLELLGCSIDFLKKHLEAQFKDGMTWENYGKHGWEIDHIYPCSKYDLTDPTQQEQCFHYSNLQPLWGVDNRIKGDKIL